MGDEVLQKAFVDRVTRERTTAMSMLFVQVSPNHQRKGLSQQVLEAFKAKARASSHRMFVPCRPMLKHRFPRVPMDQYCEWTTEDGQVFDPWLRLHLRTGRLIQVAPSSLIIKGTREEWFQWSGIDIETEGEYEVPGALSLVRRLATGEIVYHEPNVWIEASLIKEGTKIDNCSQRRVPVSSRKSSISIARPWFWICWEQVQEFCKVYAFFYGPVVIALWFLLGAFASSAWLGQHVHQQRALVVFGSTLAWAWFLQALYLVIQ